jgi:hypothetical protein
MPSKISLVRNFVCVVQKIRRVRGLFVVHAHDLVDESETDSFHLLTMSIFLFHSMKQNYIVNPFIKSSNNIVHCSSGLDPNYYLIHNVKHFCNTTNTVTPTTHNLN